GARRLADLVLVLVLGPHDHQLVHRVEVVDVELAVEAVALELERPPEQPGPGDLDLLAEAVLGDDPDSLAAGHVGDVARDREAAFEMAAVALGLDDARVDQLVELTFDLDDAGLHRLAELRGGQAHARCVAHRVGEIVEQLVQVLAEAVDRLALEAETRVTKKNDRPDTHGRSICIGAQAGLGPSVAVDPPSGAGGGVAGVDASVAAAGPGSGLALVSAVSSDARMSAAQLR